MFKAILPILCFLFTNVASGASLTIPSADGPLIINGVVDEDIWKQAIVLPSQPAEYGAPFPAGGEMRAVIRGAYLCLSARVPESGRLVARSTGANPVWWREDLVTWTVRFRGFGVSLIVGVNPLGAYRVESTGVRKEPQGPVLASAAIGSDGWSAEVAIPIERIANIGFISVERVRAPRPDAPELRWNWPGVNGRLAFELAQASSNPPTPAVVTKDWASSEPAAAPAAPQDALTAELARVPQNVWSETERKDLGVEQMWRQKLRSRVKEAALAERRDWENVRTLADWEKFRGRRLAALKASFGPFPEHTLLRAAVTRHLDYGDGFILEDVIFESRPGLLVTANLYLPAKITGRIPAIVVVHSHHAPKVQSELQDMGMTWARSGTAVLVMDQLGAGERLQTQAWPRESYYSRYALGMQLYLAGESLMKWMAWDLMRGIDLLLERPYIDPHRIVMLGAVAGGGDPAAVTAALDNRIAAVLPFNFGEAGPEEHYTMGPRRYDPGTADPGWGGWESTRCLRQSRPILSVVHLCFGCAPAIRVLI
jgi:dienelactone hydrolase